MLRALIDSSPDYIFIKDTEGRYNLSNIAYASAVQMTIPDALIGKTVLDLFPPELAAQFHAEDQAVMVSGEPAINLETQTIDRFGRPRWALTDKIPLRDSAGKIIGLIGMSRDITARKQFEEALVEQEGFLRQVIDTSPSLIFIKDRSGRYTLANRAMTKVTGIPIEKLIGKTEFEINSQPEQAEQFVRDDNEVLTTLQSKFISEEALTDAKTGETRWFQTVKTPLIAPDGNAYHVLGVATDITARRQAEKALADERNLLKTIINSIPERIFVKDTNSRFTMVNTAVALNFGFSSPDDVSGKSEFDFHSKELAATFIADEQALLQSGKAILNKEEEVTNYQTGEPQWLLTSKLPLYDSQGHIIGLVGIARDVTDWKQVSTTLADERNMLRTLIDASPDYIFIKDLEGRFVISNIAHAQAVQIADPDDMMGKTAFEFFPPEMAAQFHADDQAVLASSEPAINLERLTTDASGHPRWVLTNKIPLRDMSDKVIGLLGTSRDITERKQAEEALRERDERFQLVTRATNDAVWDWNFERDTIQWNDSVINLFEHQLEDQQSNAAWWLEKIHPDDLERVSGSIRAAIDGHEDFWTEEYRFRRADGSYAPVIDRGYISRNSTGKAIRMIGSIMDISKRKEAEQQALELAQEKARIRSLTDFFSNVSHDLRTPLTSMNTSLYLLERSTQSEPQHRYIDNLKQQTNHIQNLVEGMFTLARLDVGTNNFHFETTDINHILQEIHSQYMSLATSKQHTFTLKLDDTLPPVAVDGGELRQALREIVMNALNFTPDGGSISLETSLEKVEGQPESATIVVRDDGIGIQSEDLPHIFERFFRADKARATETGGAGLGLAIARKIIDGHNATIEVESTPGKGTVFLIRLNSSLSTDSSTSEMMILRA